MDYLHTRFLANLRDEFVDAWHDHYHGISSHIKDSTKGIRRLGERLNERISIRSRRLLHSRPTEDEIAYQATILCRDYMLQKLRNHKLLSKDKYTKGKSASLWRAHFLHKIIEEGSAERQRKTSTTSSTSKVPVINYERPPADVSKELIRVATEFETCFPHMYDDLSEQLRINFQSTPNIQNVFAAVASDIIKKGINWARIVAVFTFTGALVVECVKQGHQNCSNVVVDSLQKFVRKRLAGWIIEQGGWVGLVVHFRQRQSSVTVLRIIGIAGLFLGLVVVFLLSR